MLAPLSRVRGGRGGAGERGVNHLSGYALRLPLHKTEGKKTAKRKNDNGNRLPKNGAEPGTPSPNLLYSPFKKLFKVTI